MLDGYKIEVRILYTVDGAERMTYATETVNDNDVFGAIDRAKRSLWNMGLIASPGWGDDDA